MFPVDPRDFVSQTFMDSVAECSPNIAATDPPKEGSGFLYSWSLGDPFLKSSVNYPWYRYREHTQGFSNSCRLRLYFFPFYRVLASFYYGNLSYPSQDPPRIGLLSTVPSNADARMEAAAASASAHGGNFPGNQLATLRCGFP
jgi:hypothetical protein